MVIQKLRDLIGNLPKETGFTKRMRFHQSWWRAFVLAEEQGEHPIRNNELIGSAIQKGEISGKNFLSNNIRKAVDETIKERKLFGAGIIEEGRLFNNLLSSQPLCFNFFGELMLDKDFALQVLRCFYPDLTSVNRVIFEFAPVENYTNDKSAFDVAFEVMQKSEKGMIGFECKFTDTFSQTEYSKDEYREVYRQSNNFAKEYELYISGRYNQLFRNQLIAEALLQNEEYQFVYTGLFCHQDDKLAIKIASEFGDMLYNQTLFRVITYQEYIEKVQQLPLDWAKRELVMMLWARYCATQFSDNVN
ncbi:MAG: hypothetical protein FVQ83_12285 [Chloroflexi bacterium]|nr:hypothetical protein [Chloroflexota bacterium]